MPGVAVNPGASLLTVLLVLYSDKRNGGNSDLVHSTRLLIHHRPVDCGVKNRPDGIRLGPNPGSSVQPCRPFRHIPHHQSFSNTTVLLSLSVVSWITGRLPSTCWPLSSRIPEPRASQPDPLRLIKRVISLDLAQNKRTPCIPADRLWGRLSPPPTVKIEPIQTVRTIAVQPTFVVWCMYLHTREHDALLQPTLPTILHRPTAPSMRRTEEGPSY